MSASTATQPPANSGMIVIQLILSKIADGDNQAVQNNLARLPLAVIPSTQSETLISWFLTECMKHNNVEASRIIIDVFDTSRIRIDPLPALTQLFLNTNLSREVLLFALSCFPEKRPLDFYIDLVNTNGDMDALKIATMVNTIYPDMPSEDWISLYKLTETEEEDEEYPNPMLRIFFETKVAETGSCVSRPDWVRDYPPVEIVPVPDTIPSVKEAVDLLLEDFKKHNIAIVSDTTNESVDIQHGAEVKEQLISQYAISTIAEKIQMLSLVNPIEPFDDVAIFREYGPLNTIYTVSNAPLDPNHPCSHNGGCRMFTCTEFEQMLIDGEEIDVMAMDEYNDHSESITIEYTPYGQTEKVVEQINVTTVGTPITQIEWFRKSCDLCLKPISRKHHAVRKPLLHGGWRGCYCADCLKLTVTDPNEAIMVGRLQEQLNVIGIRDRP